VDVFVERCAGIDIGEHEVVACIPMPSPSGRGRRKQTRTFTSFTGALEEMADWFTAEGVTEIAMEATGSYWKPVWYVLEERSVELKLVNAQHVKILSGRKSDVLDAEWLAELLEHGAAARQLRAAAGGSRTADLTRYRKRLIQAHPSEGQRIERTMEDAGIKLDSMASELLGVSGRAMLVAG
jgi:transposase